MSSSPTTTQSGPPAYLAPYFDRALNRAEGYSLTPFQAYTGDRVAGTSPLEQQAFDQASGMQQPAVYGQAANLFGQAAQNQPSYNPTTFSSTYTGPGNAYSNFANYSAGNINSGYTPGQFTEGRFTKADSDFYMSPYQQGVTDIAKREADTNFQKQQTALRARMGAAGAFGGSRATLLETESQRAQDQLQNDIQTKGLQDAFSNAQGQFNADRGRQLQVEQSREQAAQAAGMQRLQGLTASEAARLSGSQLGLNALQQQEQARQYAGAQDLSAYQANQQAQQEATRLGLTANGQVLDSARGLAGLGAQQQQSELARIAQLAQMGIQQRGLEQSELDTAYQEFMRSVQDPQQKINGLLSAITGSPGQSQTTPAPSMISQLTGLGLSGAAIYNLLNGGTGTTGK